MNFDLKKIRAVFLIIFALTFLSYLNSFKNRFISDDTTLIVENKYLRGWSYLPEIFSSDMWHQIDPPRVFYYRPVHVASYLIDNSLWGLKPEGIHFLNTLLHAVNAFLVFLLLNRLTGNGYISAAAGFLFSVHPAQVECVTFMSSRGESLFLMFTLLSILFFISNRSFISSLFFLIALLSKETAIITPVLLLLTGLFFYPHNIKIRKFLPCTFILILYFVLRSYVVPPIQADSITADSFVRLFSIMTYGVIYFLRILFLPVTLSADYFPNLTFSITDLFTVFSFALSMSLIVAAFLLLKRNKLVSFSIFWFYAGILPGAQILRPLGYFIVERQLYLPSVGFCLFAGWLLYEIYKRKKNAATVILALTTLLFSMRTISRNVDWSDPFLLWGKALKKYPKSLIANVGMGGAYSEIGDYYNALRHYREALKVDAFPAKTYLRIIGVYKKMKRYDLALEEYKKIINILPLEQGYHNDIGNLYFLLGNLDKALEEYFIELTIDPKKPHPYNNIGVIYKRKKNFKLAREYFVKTLSLDPGNEMARKNLQSLEKQ